MVDKTGKPSLADLRALADSLKTQQQIKEQFMLSHPGGQQDIELCAYRTPGQHGRTTRSEAVVINMVPQEEDDAHGAVKANILDNPDGLLAGDCKTWAIDDVNLPSHENHNGRSEVWTISRRSNYKAWLKVMQHLNGEFRKIARAEGGGDGKVKKMDLSSHGFGSATGGLAGGDMSIGNAAGEDSLAVHVEDVADQAARYIEPGGELILDGCGYCADTPEGRRALKNLELIAKAYHINIKVTTDYAGGSTYATGKMLMITPEGKTMPDNSAALHERDIAAAKKEQRDSSWWGGIASIF